MTTGKVALEARVEQLSEEVTALAGRVAQLEARLALTGGEPAPVPPPPEEVPAPGWQEQGEPEDVSEEILDWAGKAHLLPRLSTLCFLLVVALILRTVTDNNLINTLAGSILGMAYAAGLMLWGAYGYERKSPLAPVFAASGCVLMCTIVVETHTRFASLPIVPAYLTLIATGGGMAFLSYRHHRFLPISLGTLGMCLAGAAIDYPHPFFPYLSLVLFAANILGYFAAKLKSCSWLRWIVLLVTMAMLQLWGVRLGMALLAHEKPSAELAPGFFLPALALFFLLYLALALVGVLRDSQEKMSRFNFSLPTLNAAWAFSAAAYQLNAMGGSVQLMGIVGVAIAAGHLAISVHLSGRSRGVAPGTNSFAVAGGVLAAIALPFAAHNFVLSLPVLSVMAFFMALISRKWKNAGIRITSYLLQLYPVVALVAALRLESALAADVVTSLPAGLLAVISLYHYQWCREYPPPAPSLFTRVDPHDWSAASLLLASLASGFVALRVVLLQVLTLSVPARELANTFGCSQSVLVNVSAAMIMLTAFAKKRKELRNVAILVTLIGAIKVFLYDLMGGHGIPLVASVFSFGVAALVESVALGRWQKAKGTAEEPAKVEESKESAGKEEKHLVRN